MRTSFGSSTGSWTRLTSSSTASYGDSTNSRHAATNFLYRSHATADRLGTAPSGKPPTLGCLSWYQQVAWHPGQLRARVGGCHFSQRCSLRQSQRLDRVSLLCWIAASLAPPPLARPSCYVSRIEKHASCHRADRPRHHAHATPTAASCWLERGRFATGGLLRTGKQRTRYNLCSFDRWRRHRRCC